MCTSQRYLFGAAVAAPSVSGKEPSRMPLDEVVERIVRLFS